MATTDKGALEGKVAAELQQIATDLGVQGYKGLKKADLVQVILTRRTEMHRRTRAGRGDGTRCGSGAGVPGSVERLRGVRGHARTGRQHQHEDRPAAPAGALRTTRRPG